MAEQWRGIPGHHYEHGFDLMLRPERLNLPFKWKTPRFIFVNSMSDLFHKDVSDEYIRNVFDVMVKTDWHVYMFLTKRSPRLASLAKSLPWPDHIWAGVTVENDRMTFRADHLRKVPAKIRFISAEPLLGPLTNLNLDHIDWVISGGESGPNARSCNIDWVRDLRDQCKQSGTLFYHKQWGGEKKQEGPAEIDGEIWQERPVFTGKEQSPAQLTLAL
jgi:protein gp37